MISDKGHFGNLEQFDDVDKILSALPLEVAVVALWEHVHHLPDYEQQILEGLDNTLAYWYHGTFVLGGDFEPTFAKNHWMIDSDCIDHLTPFLDNFVHLSKEVCYASIANGERVPIYEPGKVIVQQWLQGQRFQSVILEEIWYAPQAAHRLLSVPTLTTQGYRYDITHKESRIWNTSGDLVIQVTALSPSNNLHWFQSNQITPMGGIISSLAQDDSYHLWHHHFGHLSRNVLCQAMSKVSGMSTVIVPSFLAPCKGCALGKMHDCSYAPLDKWATRPLALVHTNMVRPMPIEPHSQSCYILTFIDDFCYVSPSQHMLFSFPLGLYFLFINDSPHIPNRLPLSYD